MYLDNFNYAILGSNTTERIVFVHGLMAFSANWRKIASHLEGEFQCLIYDQRGHGRSFKPETGYAPEDYAEDLNRITDELGWDQFHLVGHSMGARVAMMFTSLFPNKVRTLTLEDIGPEQDDGVIHYYKRMLDSVPTPFASREERNAFFNGRFQEVFQSSEPNSVLSLFLQSNIEEKENGLYGWKFSKPAIFETVNRGNNREYWKELAEFKIPILLIRGANSHLLKEETYQKMLQTNPRIEGVVIADSGHWVHYEKYQEFITELRNFLKLHNA